MLEEVELDESGMCTECIFPDIPTEFLEFQKRKLRKKYEEEDKEM